MFNRCNTLPSQGAVLTETVLYQGSTISSDTTIQLSDSIDNYLMLGLYTYYSGSNTSTPLITTIRTIDFIALSFFPIARRTDEVAENRRIYTVPTDHTKIRIAGNYNSNSYTPVFKVVGLNYDAEKAYPKSDESVIRYSQYVCLPEYVNFGWDASSATRYFLYVDYAVDYFDFVMTYFQRGTNTHATSTSISLYFENTPTAGASIEILEILETPKAMREGVDVPNPENYWKVLGRFYRGTSSSAPENVDGFQKFRWNIKPSPNSNLCTMCSIIPTHIELK